MRHSAALPDLTICGTLERIVELRARHIHTTTGIVTPWGNRDGVVEMVVANCPTTQVI